MDIETTSSTAQGGGRKLRRFVVVMCGCQSEPTDGPKGR